MHLLCLLLALLSANICTEAVFEVTPKSFTLGLEAKVMMRCEIVDLVPAISSVLAIQIEKEEGGQIAPLVTFRDNQKPNIIAVLLAPRLDAEGVIDQVNIGATYLQLTLKHPQAMDTGNYICSVTLIDKTGIIKTMNFDATLDTAPVTNETLVSVAKTLFEQNIILQANLTALERKTQDLSQRLTACESGMASLGAQVSLLSDKINKTESDVTKCVLTAAQSKQDSQQEFMSLKNQLTVMSTQCPHNCTDQINVLVSNMSHVITSVKHNSDAHLQLNQFVTSLNASCHQTPVVAFSARFRSTVTTSVQILPKHSVNFDDVLLNKGNAYNPANGTFTAPVDGTYVFMLNLPLIGTDQQEAYNVALTKRHHSVITQIEQSYGTDIHPNSVSVVCNLKAGEDISTMAERVAGGTQPTAFPTVSTHAAFFSGFLLAADGHAQNGHLWHHKSHA